MMAAVRLVLASASPRRAELLRAAGFSFDTLVVDIDETRRSREEPAEYVRRLAMEKSARAQAMIGQSPAEAGHYAEGPAKAGRHAIEARHHDDGPADYLRHGQEAGRQTPIVLGADTAVVVDDEILGKPL